MIAGIAHVNLTVPENTLHLASEFYGETLGLTPRAVPSQQRGRLAWFDIGSSGQQVHVAPGPSSDFEKSSGRHPCFKLESVQALLEVRQRIWEHYERGGDAAPKAADKPGGKNSGEQGVEYPERFFARDFAGNRLEFTI
ncbi:hypothetical protein EDD37DRAFT_171438 [Exophiala viscosa]|uniref:VOC domain-containing protein n=1 Tax=Exophiala viscosa TaxID=2486360 RepID=A0AAN6DM35_9EURO|nr:hypothetical protein EDD36DRAFT_102365 [Exophiala viscosa]KAI1620252.1 hypothetical protein EDD37DRAFT_171438 [Exophiala viscosa]